MCALTLAGCTAELRIQSCARLNIVEVLQLALLKFFKRERPSQSVGARFAPHIRFNVAQLSQGFRFAKLQPVEEAVIYSYVLEFA